MNLEETLFQDGRLTPMPKNRCPKVTVARIDFESLHQSVSSRLTQVFLYHQPLFKQYDGTDGEITRAIKDGIKNLLDQAMNELWNRLRWIAESYSPATRANIFERKAPSMYGLKLPSFIASMFSGIGPLHIEDNLFGASIVIYAPSHETRDYFGRTSLTVVDGLTVRRFLNALSAINVPLGVIQQNCSNPRGAFFTTCSSEEIEFDSFEIDGAFHMRYYTRSDVVMAILFAKRGLANNPFEDISHTLGFVDNKAVVDEIEKYFALKDRDKHDHEPNEAMPVFQPIHRIPGTGAAPRNSDVTVPNQRKEVYIIGTGCTRIGHCSLVRHLSGTEISMVIRDRILTNPAGQPQQV